MTFDLCSPVIPFSSSARLRLKVFLYLQKKKQTRKQKRKTVIMDTVCGGVDQEHRRAACSGLNTYITEQTLRAITVKKVNQLCCPYH